MKLLSIALVFVSIAGSAFGEDPEAKPTPTPPVRDIPDAPSHLRQQPATSSLTSATPAI